MDGVTVREARVEDCPEILRLIIELAVYENMEDQVHITIQELEDDFKSTNKYFHCYVAEDSNSQGSKLVGYVLYFYHYSTWEGKFPYMEDLYVSPDHRGKGIGSTLWKCVVKEALEKNCKRLHFNVLDWNKSSIEYYKRKGAVDLTDKEGWHLFRMTPKDMKDFLGSS